MKISIVTLKNFNGKQLEAVREACLPYMALCQHINPLRLCLVRPGAVIVWQHHRETVEAIIAEMGIKTNRGTWSLNGVSPGHRKILLHLMDAMPPACEGLSLEDPEIDYCSDPELRKLALKLSPSRSKSPEWIDTKFGLFMNESYRFPWAAHRRAVEVGGTIRRLTYRCLAIQKVER